MIVPSMNIKLASCMSPVTALLMSNTERLIAVTKKSVVSVGKFLALVDPRKGRESNPAAHVSLPCLSKHRSLRTV